MYFLLLLIGAFGFLAMTFMGMAHGVGGHHAPAVAHPRVNIPGHAHAGASQHGSTHHSGTAHARHANHPHGGGFDPWRLIVALSPLNIFAMAFGAGAVGILAKTIIKGGPLAACAVIGGFIFAFGIVRPLMGYLMNFASTPSDGLEGQVSAVGEAVTRFDSEGRGLIKLVYDEQNVQLLGTLDKSEREAGVQVLKGEKVVIISVDATRNTCLVSRDIAPTTDAGIPEDASQVKS